MLNFFLIWLSSALGWFLLSSLVAVIGSSPQGPLQLKHSFALGLVTSIFLLTLQNITM